jgi:hypothetical protein
VVLLLLALVWWASVLARLATSDTTSRRPLDALTVGTTSLPDPRVETTGEWVVQTVGGERFVATRTAGDTLRFRFVGTEVAVTVRLGPDAGPVAVRIEQEQSSGSHASPRIQSQELDLRRSVATAGTVTLADELAPGLHAVEIRNLEAAELAVTAVVVGNRPSIGWAWATPTALALLLLVPALHAWWRLLATRLGWTFSDGRLR